MDSNPTRRDFIRATAAAGAAVQTVSVLRGQEAAGRVFKIALIGCGGRGKGAVRNALEAGRTIGAEVKVVALADAFEDRLNQAQNAFHVPPERCFLGLDSYRRVMETEADIVLMATPPAFRPVHAAAAIEAGKNVFFEKPVAVDPPGARRVIEIGEQAREKGLAMVAGTQRRHSKNYLRNAYAVHNGAIGDIAGGAVYWCGRVPWIRDRREGWDDTTYFLRNWLNFTEMSGDHIVEQHVHNLDVANWFIGRMPRTAIGFGSRARRRTGNQFDFFSIDFDYGEDLHIHSMCRQLKGCYNRVGEFFRGTQGVCYGGGKLRGENEVEIPEFTGHNNGQVQEHADLMQSIIDGEPLNEAYNVATSTMTAIMGRLACYTGELIRWSDLMKNEDSKWYNFTCTPTALQVEAGPIELPVEEPAIPGKA